jgi:FkbH-like protein
MRTIRKCLVWDLDNTLWDGVCLEGPVTIKPEVAGAIMELDRRGILHSIASRGDEDLALQILRQFALERYFLLPQINWLPKAQSIARISRQLELSLDAIAFIDDDAFEREQVAYMLPGVLTIPAERATELPHQAEFIPVEVTEEAESRRQFYRSELDRHRAESSFTSREEFLGSCAMKLSIREMRERDIPRVSELMTRTHQLNTTGLMMAHEQLRNLLHDEDRRHRVFVAELQDKFGGYGIIGTALVDESPGSWVLKYLALSCRVMGRGIERAFLSKLIRGAVKMNAMAVDAEFRDTGRNRMMRAMYQMMGFRAVGDPDEDGRLILRADLRDVPKGPSWVEVA